MDPRLIVIIAGLFVAAVGYLCLAPDQFAFLRLPPSFAALGIERIVTGLALMLLGFVGALSELQGEPRRRRARPFAFGDDLAVAGAEAEPERDAPRPPGLMMLDPEPEAAAPVAETVPERHVPIVPVLSSRYIESPPEP